MWSTKKVMPLFDRFGGFCLQMIETTNENRKCEAKLNTIS